MDERTRHSGPEPDEIDQTLDDPDPDSSFDDASQQDFALRNVAMSNTLGQAGAAASAPAAGAVIGSGGDLELEPRTDEEEAEDAAR